MTTVRRLVLVFLMCVPALAHPASVSVHNLRQWRAPDHTRLVFDLSGPLEHRLFTLQSPARIVIDMGGARLSDSLPELDYSGPLLASVRTGRQEGDVLRIVLDLKAEARPRTFVLTPAGQYGHRLVIDLFDTKQSDGTSDNSGRWEPAPVQSVLVPSKRDVVIAIDAGHGGEDPGAIGRRYRTREKEVTLAIARELEKLVEATPGMRPVMIRDGDYYIGLKDRYLKAERHRADVFVSIHADAVSSGRAYGSSIYVLSERGASSVMAQLLADKENAADLIGGVRISDSDDQLRKTIVDLKQTKTVEYSMVLADDILNELDKVGPIHLKRIGQAGFAVLKSYDVPSALVETAFISSPSEEKKLRTRGHQRKYARAILGGIKRYVARPGTRIPGTVVAQQGAPLARLHVVQPGETLAVIADKYDVHVDVLRFANDLVASEPRAGSRLRIP